MLHTHPSPPAKQQEEGGSIGLASAGVGTLQRGVLSMSESQYPEQHWQSKAHCTP